MTVKYGGFGRIVACGGESSQVFLHDVESGATRLKLTPPDSERGDIDRFLQVLATTLSIRMYGRYRETLGHGGGGVALDAHGEGLRVLPS